MHDMLCYAVLRIRVRYIMHVMSGLYLRYSSIVKCSEV